MSLEERKQYMSQCWRCSHCKWVPAPKSVAFAGACPSIQWGDFHAYSGGGKVITAYGLMDGKTGYSDVMLETVYACTMCGACDTACKSNNGELVEPLDTLYALRERIADDGKCLPVHVAMIDSLRQNGNPFGRPRTDRSQWARGLDLKDATKQPVPVLLHIGCENAFEPAMWPELHAIVGLLQRAGVDFGLAFDAESSTGELAFDLGFQNDARALAQRAAALIASTGAKTVVSCSAGSYAAFRNTWPRLGVALPAVEVLHITEFVEGLVRSGALALKAALNRKVTYHDPCKLGRLSEPYTPSDAAFTRVLNVFVVHDKPKPMRFGNGGLYEAPRRLLARIDGLELVEMERNRVASYCCGAGGGAPQAYPDFATFAAKERLKEARATGAATVVTACGGCQCHLAAAAAEGAEVIGLFQLIALAAGAAQPASVAPSEGLVS